MNRLRPTKQERNKLYVQIAEVIRDAVMRGDFGPGDKLPPLAVMADQFQCSRATVREALGTLRGQGLVEFRHGDGIYVRSATVDLWMEPLEAAILLGVNHAEELLLLEISILAGVASMVADPARSHDLSALGQALFQVECAPPGSEEALAAELGFYTALSGLAGSEVMENALRVMQEALRSSVRLMKGQGWAGRDVCRAVYDAVRDHNAEAAREALFTYGQAIRDRLHAARFASAGG